LLATQRTVNSNIYEIELKKINPAVSLHSVGARLLVPLIENQGDKYMDMILQDYMQPLKDANVESIILGCTHYVALKDQVKAMTGGKVEIISQDDIIPAKFEDYLQRHPEHEEKLSRGGSFEVHATDANEIFADNIAQIMGKPYKVATANY